MTDPQDIIRIALLAALAAQVGGAAAAQEPQPRVATREQYANCLDTQDSIDQRIAILAKRQDDQNAFGLKVQAADERLQAQVRQHAPKTKDEIASYNRAIDKRNQAVKDFNEQGKGLQRDQEALNASIVRLNAQCGPLLIPLDIKDEVEQERKARSAKQ